jgi:hypothetical protein
VWSKVAGTQACVSTWRKLTNHMGCIVQWQKVIVDFQCTQTVRENACNLPSTATLADRLKLTAPHFCSCSLGSQLDLHCYMVSVPKTLFLIASPMYCSSKMFHCKTLGRWDANKNRVYFWHTYLTWLQMMSLCCKKNCHSTIVKEQLHLFAVKKSFFLLTHHISCRSE